MSKIEQGYSFGEVRPPAAHPASQILGGATGICWLRECRVIADRCLFQRRDEHRKLHPLIVNFERLPDTEKQYNRQLAQDTLKLVSLLVLLVHREQDCKTQFRLC